MEAMGITALLLASHLLVQLLIAVRVIMRRRSVGESLAWIMIVFVFPIVGIVSYLLVGELRLGSRRARRITELFGPIQQWFEELHQRRHRLNWAEIGNACEQLSHVGKRSIGVPTLPGNEVQLIDQWKVVFDQLISDIDAARRTCHLEFYIWNVGGRADDVAEALIRARQRDVICRVLVDAVGSRRFLRSKLAYRMREAGIQMIGALPGGPLRLPFVRFDLRLHRKIVVIDGETAYTGSLNLVDPRYFKQDAGVGQWIDAMVRVRGPSVEGLAIVFLADWYMETADTIDELRYSGDASPQPEVGDCAIQALPSGPSYEADAIEQILITAVYAARRELILTTPYFVPNESMRMALVAAARRGIKVILIVPAAVDSLLVRYASQAFKGDLLQAGVRIALFKGGLLHTKSVTVDGEFSLFGSLNLDPRSLYLNFEITLAIYNRSFTQRLRQLQQNYIDQSELMDLEAWYRRPPTQRFVENVARLFGPLL
jgi:cardiolipin synthase